MEKKSKKYLVISATYNENENIAALIKEILKQNDLIEVLIVDDNSPDGTGQTVDEIVKKNKRVHVIHRSGKLGYGSAYVAGFKYALKNNYDLIFQIDADFSHDPRYLNKLIDASLKYDLTLGSRWTKGGGVVGWPWYRFCMSWGANLIARTLLSLKPRDITTGYRCYNRRVLLKINLNGIVSSGYAFLEELLFRTQKAGFSIGEIPITFVDRKAGQSKMGFHEVTRSAKAIFSLFVRRKGVGQLVKFGIVGVSGAVVDLGIYNLLAILFGYNIYIARAISFTLAATNNYILNRKWTFRSTETKIASEFGKFFLISSIGLFMNLGIMKLLQPFAMSFSNHIIQKNVPVLIAIAIVLAWNFMANKYWTFRD